jgi:hypothetical protein
MVEGDLVDLTLPSLLQALSKRVQRRCFACSEERSGALYF